jgi:hypothetical protein
MSLRMVSSLTCSRELQIKSAPERFSADVEFVTAMHLEPAALAACTPLGASSKTTQSGGEIPIRLAAVRNFY